MLAVTGPLGAIERHDPGPCGNDCLGRRKTRGDIDRVVLGKYLVDADDRQARSLGRGNIIGPVGADADCTAIAGRQRHGAHELSAMQRVIRPRLAGYDKAIGQDHFTAPDVMPAINCRDSRI
jgi:hypothetical protein